MNKQELQIVIAMSEVVATLRDWFRSKNFVELRLPTLRTVESVGGVFSGVPLVLDGSKVALTRGSIPALALSVLDHVPGFYSIGPAFRAELPRSNNCLDEYTYVQLVFNGSYVQSLSFANEVFDSLVSHLLQGRLLTPKQVEKLERGGRERNTIPYSAVIGSEYKPTDGDLTFQQELKILEQGGGIATFLLNSPIGMKRNFADVRQFNGMHLDFELILPYSGETMAGGQFETDRDALKRQLEVSCKMLGKTSIPTKEMDSHLAIEDRSISFFGIGLERLVQFLLSRPKISDIVPFDYSPISGPKTFGGADRIEK